MTAVAPAFGLAETDARPPFAAPAFAAQLLETCAAAAAVGSAIELGVFARVTDGAADPATVAADCGLTSRAPRRSSWASPVSASSRSETTAALGRQMRGLVDFAELLRP